MEFLLKLSFPPSDIGDLTDFGDPTQAIWLT